MKQNAEPNTQPKREGIALIVVLGFLSILILMAIAFLTNMRTERLVAETAKDDVRVRHLTHSALAAAMDDVNYFLRNYTNGTMNLATGPRPVNIHVTPNWAIITSTNIPSYTNLGSNVRLISGEVTNWLPRKYLYSQDFNYNATSKAARAEWILIPDPNPLPGQPTNILGRYAYLAFDCTGMMDANLFTYPVQRGEGISVPEISIAYLPDVVDYNINKYSEKNFFDNKANYSRFGTFPEILFLNDGVPNASGYSEAQALSLTNVNNLMPYSLCYDAGWWDWSAANWKAGDYGATNDIGAWTNELYARNAFQGVGFTAAQASNMAVCYQDYVDTDSLPGGTNPVVNPSILCCETIPMINEVILTNELSESGGFLTHNAYIDVELWYPFLGFTNNERYTVDVSGRFSCNIAALKPDDFANQTAINNYQFSVNGSFGVLRCPLASKRMDTNDLPSLATNMLLSLRLSSVRVLLSGTATAVDSCTVLTGLPIRITVPLPAASATVSGTNGASVLDPRLNHLLNNSWGLAPITYSTTNSGPVGLSANGDREGTVMYVRNGPMQSVAELGFIPTGSPWTTIDLFSPQGRELLAKFRTTNITAGTKIYTNGLINPNTLFTDVLIAAFRDAPIEAYPDDPLPLRVDADMAGDIAAGMYEISTNAALSGSNVFDSPAVWVTTRAFAVHGTLSTSPYPTNNYTGLDNNQKESIIRNSYRLFNPNQQLFTIVVIAQAINDQPDGMGKYGTYGNEDTIVGEKRAVALVWRDPFPDPPPGGSGRHEMFVRTFKYLDE